MPRDALNDKIRDLLHGVVTLAAMVERAAIEAVAALKARDLDAAGRVYDRDRQINAQRFAVENECVATIATQQPIVARDLRVLASILVVITDLERMGDYAKGIARICVLMGPEPHVKPLIDIPRMADLAVGMLHRAVEAFVAADAEVAHQIPLQDDEVDALYNQVYRELVTLILANPSMIDRANHLMWAAHNLERMADRVTNICERTIYVATGELRELSISDDEAVQRPPDG